MDESNPAPERNATNPTGGKPDTEWMGWPICVSVLLLLVAVLAANRMALEQDLQRGERCLEAQEGRK